MTTPDSGSTKAVVRLAETIEHQRQPTDKSCTATCIAMALGVPVQSLGVDFTHPYLPEAAAIWLAERGIWLRACDRNEQPRRHAVYLVGIRSLNTVNSDHSVLLDTRGEPYPAGDGMHCGWKFYDPNKGREGKQHTEWVDTNWFLDLYEFCERGRYREFGDAPRFSSEPVADDLHLMLMAQATSRLQNIHELEAELARVSALADKLWRLCVDEGWPWNDVSTQDDLTELGLLYPKDMTTAEGEDGLCDSCDGDCKVCYRAVKHVRDAKQPETKVAVRQRWESTGLCGCTGELKNGERPFACEHGFKTELQNGGAGK